MSSELTGSQGIFKAPGTKTNQNKTLTERFVLIRVNGSSRNSYREHIVTNNVYEQMILEN